MSNHIPIRKRKGAETPARRSMTAREGAERFGVSTRTIQRVIAEPRAEFLARAAERRKRVLELRAQGLKLREIAEELEMTTGGVGTILHHVRKAQAKATPPEQSDPRPETPTG